MAQALIIVGSPRRGGNSDAAAAEAAAVLRGRGVTAETVYLRELRFSPCLACGACDRGGLCVQKDDLAPLYTRLLAAELIIVCTPIYFQSLGALAKGFVDRAQPFWAVKFRHRQNVIADAGLRRRRRLAAFLCGGTDYPDTFACAEKTLRLFAMMVEAKYAGGVCFPRVDAPGDIFRDGANRRCIAAAVESWLG